MWTTKIKKKSITSNTVNLKLFPLTKYVIRRKTHFRNFSLILGGDIRILFCKKTFKTVLGFYFIVSISSPKNFTEKKNQLEAR